MRKRGAVALCEYHSEILVRWSASSSGELCCLFFPGTDWSCWKTERLASWGCTALPARPPVPDKTDRLVSLIPTFVSQVTPDRRLASVESRACSLS